MVDILVNITVNIDYPDEDIEQITYDKLEKDLEEVSKIFDEYKIPYFLSKAYDVSEHYLVRFIRR